VYAQRGEDNIEKKKKNKGEKQGRDRSKKTKERT
jgi:hypothetical protein